MPFRSDFPLDLYLIVFRQGPPRASELHRRPADGLQAVVAAHGAAGGEPSGGAESKRLALLGGASQGALRLPNLVDTRQTQCAGALEARKECVYIYTLHRIGVEFIRIILYVTLAYFM